MDLIGQTVGLAFLGTMCDCDVSIGLTQDGARGSVESVGATAAHELGHILNMGHDSSKKCYYLRVILLYYIYSAIKCGSVVCLAVHIVPFLLGAYSGLYL